ncbi:MAG: hypothetical protein AAF790_09560, partial [Planctomycetota bacterium]
MASPFRFFRKYTGVMMVFLCALLMVAFGLGDIVGRYGGGGPGSDPTRGETAVSWDGGELTKGELDELLGRRQLLASVLAEIAQQGMITAAAEGVVDPRPLVQPLSLPTQEPLVREHVVLSKLYAETAADAGLVVSDETISDYLSDLG